LGFHDVFIQWAMSFSIGQRPRNFLMRAWSSMNCVCSPILVVLITYLGAIGAWGMHLSGIQAWAAFGCEDSTSVFGSLLTSISSCRNWSRRCRGGSKDGRRAREFLGSFGGITIRGGFHPSFCSHSSEVVKAVELRRSARAEGLRGGLGRQEARTCRKP